MAKYPNGLSSFEKIRQGGFVYVDKTDFIVKLLENGGTYFFLARPRRFGKSLFVSTLEAFFQGKQDLFKGLAIESYDWNWEEYPVFRIDFTPKSYTEENDIKKVLNETLGEYERRYGLCPEENEDIQVRFHRLISAAYEQTGKQVVVLVDEYEKPVIDNLQNEEIREKHRSWLAGFYSVLKALDAKLKLVFLTGVSKFGQMSVFSGLNNIRDISLSPDFGAICGVTEKELLENFQEGILGVAEGEETDFEGALALLKRNYDGYHFSYDCPDIYNPYSIINAMENRRIGAYWALSGMPTLLAKILQKKDYDLTKLNGTLANEIQLSGIDNVKAGLIALFYQAGYLTIKQYNKRLKLYSLGFPNVEVESSFFDYLLPVYSSENKSVTSSAINDIALGFDSGNPEKSLTVLQSFTAGITYELMDKIKIEQHFENIIYIILKALLPYVSEVKAEERTSDGRTDIIIKTHEYIYIIELKIDSSAQDALQQIEEKNYALPYSSDPRPVFLIGINFSTENRRIDEWLIKKVR